MKRFLLCLMLVGAMMLSVSCSGASVDVDDWDDDSDGSSNKGNGGDKDNVSAVDMMIASIGRESVTVEIGEIEEGRYGASAHVTAQVPNYTELFIAAYAEADPDKALQNAIKKKEYTTVEYEGYATVIYEGEEQIVETDELVEDFIEQELIKAINAVLEMEEAGE